MEVFCIVNSSMDRQSVTLHTEILAIEKSLKSSKHQITCRNDAFISKSALSIFFCIRIGGKFREIFTYKKNQRLPEQLMDE